jgi:isopentenyl-diphosphate delta-isomerase
MGLRAARWEIDRLTREERVVLVDADDREIGTEEKLRAHQSGVLHRAFSVFVMDDEERVLLQKRAAGKYHSGGLWTNTCCGHPRPAEDIRRAAERRLQEEMGIAVDLEPGGTFLYRANLDNGLVEHELDHLFLGRFNGSPTPDPNEAAEWMWEARSRLEADCQAQPERYTAWLPLALRALSGR